MLRRLLPILLFAAVAAQAAPFAGDLRGGHFATLALDPALVDARAEEWEAFLSVDGGKFYSVRLTPHLGIGIRSYDVLVPNVDSSDVRVLIRTGNERVETLNELPQRFRIHADRTAATPLARSQAHAPESARPGEAKVVVWAEDGRVETSAAIPFNVREKIAAGAHNDHDPVLPTPAIAPQTHAIARPFTSAPPRPHAPAPPVPDILLLTTRLNV